MNFFPGEDPYTGNDGVADATSVSLEYEKDLLYAAIAHDRDVDGEEVETTRLVGGYTFGPARVMLLYQLTDAGVVDEDGFGGSVAWTFGNNAAKLQYLTADIWRIDPQADPLDNRLENLLSVGLDHELGEYTRLFGFYTTGDIGGTDESNDTSPSASSTTSDESGARTAATTGVGTLWHIDSPIPIPHSSAG